MEQIGEEIGQMLRLARELGISEDVRTILKNKYPEHFVMDHSLFEIYPDRNMQPIGIVFENIVIALNDAPEEMVLEEAKAYCQNVIIGGIPCDVFPDDFYEKYRGQINAALRSIGGQPLRYDRYMTENTAGKAKVRPVMIIK